MVFLAPHGLSFYAASASVWIPNTVESDQHPFGVFGMALALVRSFTGDGAAILLDAGAGAHWPTRTTG